MNGIILKNIPFAIEIKSELAQNHKFNGRQDFFYISVLTANS